jgi:glycosyltransferase involved in cell wall biosynthesis
MKKNQIALLHYAAPPTIGGVEFLIANHARLLAQHGYAVKIVTGRGEPFDERIPVCVNPLFDSRHAEVVATHHDLAHGQVSDAFRTLVAHTQAALADALADCEVCIAHNVVTLHKNLALTVALKQLSDAGRVRLVAWGHDFAWTDPTYHAELHDGWPWDLLRVVWAHTAYVVVSHARRPVLSQLLDLPEAHIRVILAGVDPQAFLGIGPDVAQWAERFGWWQAEPLMLLPARVTRRKNIELGIELTAALQARGLTPQLIVMGPLGAHNPSNAAYLQTLRDLCEARNVRERVIFLQEHGTVSNAARRDLYVLADLLLFPSVQEGFGVPVLEGGLAKLPIFCSDIPPFREGAGDHAHYFQLDESPERIAARMCEVLNADKTYQLRRHVLREYDWQAIWREQLAPLLQEAVQ